MFELFLTRARLAHLAVAIALAALAACQGKSESKAKGRADGGVATGSAPADGGTGAHPAPLRPPKVTPPLPVDQPPADAETITGVEDAPRAVIHIKRLTPGTGEKPGRNDTVRLNYSGWRTSGDTFVTTTVRKRPVTQSLAVLAPGFAIAVASMRQGERAMMWIPPELGYAGKPTAAPETTVYEVELISFERGPATPPDVATPPPNARKTPSGTPYIVVGAGTGKVKPRGFDVVTIEYSAWSSTGRLFDSTEVTKQPKQTFAFREPPALDEMLRTMVAGQKVRLWLPADQLEQLPSTPAGQVCYELTLVDITPKQAPPPVPVSVAAPPAKAKQTAGGVHYEVMKAGTGTARPAKTDRVKMHYTGWRTDGRMFDSSEIHDRPAVAPVGKLTAGWAEVMAEMVVGERRRLWIPEHLAYAKAPGSPAGMIVMEVELLEILAPPPRPETGQSLVRP